MIFFKDDPNYSILYNDDSYKDSKISCFYFTSSRSNELKKIVGNSTSNKLVNKIMTHAYLKYLLKNRSRTMYQNLSNSPFNIKLTLRGFSNLKSKLL